MQLGLKPSGHGADQPDRRQSVIAALIHDELVRQKATELGLEPQGAYAEELARLQTQLTTVRRRGLADAYFRQEIAKKAEPTEAEARAYFDRHAAMIRTEVHVFQLLMRDEAQLATVQRALQNGATFEDLARRQFPALPEGAGVPWDLGYLGWKQLPDAWRPVLDTLKPGDSSPIIRGPNGRFWLIQLRDRRAKPELTFEDVRLQVVEDLKRTRLEQLTAQADAELRKSARVVMSPISGDSP